jgi:glycosyltransferase involved in cell wall biosynthesis
VLHALGNDLLGSVEQERVLGNPHVGVVFFENTNFSRAGGNRARQYDAIVAGSTWNAEVLAGEGVGDVLTVFQGIDPSLFHPADRARTHPGRFVVFSGGKLEYRKGQDIVIEAFRAFHQRHPDALLMVAWQNFHGHEQMPPLVRDGHLETLPETDAGGQLVIGPWLASMGLPEGSVVDLGAMPNYVIGPILQDVDVAIFPNRCEGGTNLVAMECMACGVPVILSANTGHLDLIHPDRCLSLNAQSPVTPPNSAVGVDGWGESDVDEVVEALEAVYSDRKAAKGRAAAAVEFMRDWTWERQVERLVIELDRLI